MAKLARTRYVVGLVVACDSEHSGAMLVVKTGRELWGGYLIRESVTDSKRQRLSVIGDGAIRAHSKSC